MSRIGRPPGTSLRGVLGALSRRAGHTMTTLSRRLKKPIDSVRPHLQEAEARGLVSQRADRYSITAAGFAELERLQAASRGPECRSTRKTEKQSQLLQALAEMPESTTLDLVERHGGTHNQWHLRIRAAAQKGLVQRGPRRGRMVTYSLTTDGQIAAGLVRVTDSDAMDLVDWAVEAVCAGPVAATAYPYAADIGITMAEAEARLSRAVALGWMQHKPLLPTDKGLAARDAWMRRIRGGAA